MNESLFYSSSHVQIVPHHFLQKASVHDRLLPGAKGEKASATRCPLPVNTQAAILASSTKMHVVRHWTCLTLAAEQLRRNWNSDSGNCSCFCFAFETFLFTVVEKFEENCCFSSFWIVKTAILIYS